MPVGKKELNELRDIQRMISRAMKYVSRPEVQGLAEQIPEFKANGGDYHLINPKCMETTYNLNEFLRVHSVDIGSEFCYFSNANDALKRFIENQERKMEK